MLNCHTNYGFNEIFLNRMSNSKNLKLFFEVWKAVIEMYICVSPKIIH